MKITDQDLLIANKLIEKLKPKRGPYDRYLKKSKSFIDVVQNLYGVHKKLLNVNSFELVESTHFEQKYLVGFVKKELFANSVGSNYNAAAASSFQFLNIESPPIVLFPGKTLPKKKGYLSIIEHEFVHVNQMISFEQTPDILNCVLETEVLFQEFCKLIRFEYEAHFIQLTKDPSLLPQNEDISLAKWCCLCGYASGLERVLLRFILEDYSLRNSKSFFKKIKKSLPDAFLNLDLDISIAKDFVSDLKRHRGIALINVYDQYPGIINIKNFKEIALWINGTE